MATSKLEKLMQEARSLSAEDKLQLIQQVALWLRDEYPKANVEQAQETESWDIEELRTLIQNNNPKTPQEIIESGLIGAWGDFTPLDTPEWINQRKAKRKAKHAW